MNTKVTPEVAKFILENYLQMSQGSIAKHFGFSKAVCKTFYRKNNLIVPKAVIEGFRTKGLTDRTTFTEEEDQFIKDNYLTIPIKTIGHHIKRSYCGVSGRLKSLNLIIPEEIIQQRKNDSVFKPGQIPFNKGKRISEFMTPEQIEKTKATRFQSGHKPHNTCENDGEIRIRTDHKDRNGRQNKWIRISLGNWKQLHVHNWELKNGSVPEGQLVSFKDGNSLNTEIENLELITMEQNMLQNSIHNYPEDMKEILQLKGRVIRQINKHQKK